MHRFISSIGIADAEVAKAVRTVVKARKEELIEVAGRKATDSNVIGFDWEIRVSLDEFSNYISYRESKECFG